MASAQCDSAGDIDNNAATITDLAWTPVVPTPNHPEYPAAHSCTAGVLGELLRQYYMRRRGDTPGGKAKAE